MIPGQTKDSGQSGILIFFLIVQTCLYIIKYRQIREQTDILEGSRNTFFVDLNGALSGDILTVQENLAIGRLIDTCQHIEYSSLTSSVWPDQTIKLSLFNGQIEIVYCTQTSKRNTKVFYFKHCHDYCTSFSFFLKMLRVPSFSRNAIPPGLHTRIIVTIRTTA